MSAYLYFFRSDYFLRSQFNELTDLGVQVAVVLGSGINLKAMYEMVLSTNSSIQYWLLAGVDVDDELLPILFSPEHPVILFRKFTEGVPTFDSNIEEVYEFSDKIKRLNLVKSYIDYMNSCRKYGTSTVLNDSRCSDQIKHSNLQKMMVEESVDRLLSSMMSGM